MARKIKQILELTGQDGLLFASWMTRQGLDSKQQFEHIQSGWLARVAAHSVTYLFSQIF